MVWNLAPGGTGRVYPSSTLGDHSIRQVNSRRENNRSGRPEQHPLIDLRCSADRFSLRFAVKVRSQAILA